MEFLRKEQTLNQIERWKLERHPLDVREAVIERYALEGPAAIDQVPGEAERLKWVGLYPQRQGGDAFMVRIKIPGGRLTAEQAGTIGELADRHARGPEPNPVFGQGFLDLTTRQDIQLHWIRIGDVPEVWRRLEAVGITTTQACGDSARNVLCCPVSGLDADEVLDAFPVAVAISDFFTGNREYANLPRKFKMSVTGCREDCAKAEINDVGLWPARLDGGTVGFNLLVGGGLSDCPRPTAQASCGWPPTRTSSSPASPTSGCRTCSPSRCWPSTRLRPAPSSAARSPAPAASFAASRSWRPRRGPRSGPAGWTATSTSGARRSSGCTCRAARPRAPSRRSPTSACAGRSPRPATPSSRRSTSGLAAASAATPPSSTSSRAPGPPTRSPPPCAACWSATGQSAATASASTSGAGGCPTASCASPSAGVRGAQA